MNETMINQWDGIRIKCFLDEVKAMCEYGKDNPMQPHMVQAIEEIEYLWSTINELNNKAVDLEIELAAYKYKHVQVSHPQE